MPRQLLRNGRIVDDDWTYLVAAPGVAAPGAEASTGASVIVPFERWLAERETWLDRQSGRLGVLLQPVHKVEQLAPDLPRLELVAAEFPSPAEGRGYTQARLLRERHGFKGELRAAGYVRRDQVFFMARCGFDSFELPPGDLPGAAAALATFSGEYQPANDQGLSRKLRRR